MSARLLRLVVACLCLAAATGHALAQGRGPGGPGGPPVGGNPAGRVPGGPGGPPASGPGAGGNSSGTARGTGQMGPVGRWWDSKQVVQAVGLRKSQQQKMDSIFNESKPAIVTTYKSLLAEQAKLDKLSKDPKVDKAQLFAAIDSVSQAHAALEKAYTQMLLQIRQEMDADQISKLEALH